jgi:hypothetical protein
MVIAMSVIPWSCAEEEKGLDTGLSAEPNTFTSAVNMSLKNPHVHSSNIVEIVLKLG